MATPALADMSMRARIESVIPGVPMLWRLIYDSFAEAVYGIDLNGNCTVCNPACLRILHLDSQNDLLGKNMHRLIHHTRSSGEPCPMEDSEIWKALQAGKGSYSSGDLIWRADGSSFPAECWSTPTFKESELLGCVVAFADTTAKNLVTNIPRDLEDNYRVIIQELGVFWSSDADGNIVVVSPNVERVFGYQVEEILALGKRFWPGAVHPEDLETVTTGLALLLSEGGVSDLEYRIESKAGGWVPGHVRAIRGRGEDGAFYVHGIFTDLTSRRRMEEQLRQAHKMEAVGLLAGGIAHDFNNLITVILGYSQEMRERLAGDEASQLMVDEIYRAGERAASLTHQLLAFSRRQVLAASVLDMNEVVVDAEKMIRRLIGEDIELIVRPGRMLWHVKADRGQIEQVLMNLVANARDALPLGGEVIIQTSNTYFTNRDECEELAKRPGPYVMLRVSDTGCGMDAETRSHMFDPFFTTKDPGKGTGLGLSTTYGIVKQSGGVIQVESEPEQGTTFMIYFPAFEDSSCVPENRHRVEGCRPTAGTILLVEDEDALRQLVVTVLRRQGYKVLAVAGPERALTVAKNYPEPIDLLLTDVVMPKMRGTELAGLISRWMPVTKVLYMSGYTDSAVTDRGPVDLNESFLQKPFSPQHLVQKVQEVLAEAWPVGDDGELRID